MRLVDHDAREEPAAVQRLERPQQLVAARNLLRRHVHALELRRAGVEVLVHFRFVLREGRAQARRGDAVEVQVEELVLRGKEGG